MPKTVEDLEVEVAAMQKRLTDKEKEIDGIQSLKGKWSGEVGEVREQLKELASLKDAAKTLTESLDAVKKELDALKSKGTETREDKKPTELELSDKELADKLESKLNDAQKKELDAFLDKLTKEDQARFESDDTYRVAVLEQATGNGEGSPDSKRWRIAAKKPKASGEDIKALVADLFKKHKSGNLVIDERGGGYGVKREVKAEKPVKFL